MPYCIRRLYQYPEVPSRSDVLCNAKLNVDEVLIITLLGVGFFELGAVTIR